MSFMDVSDVVPEKRTFEPIPKGEYDLEVVNAELRDTNGAKGPGKAVNVQFRVLSGDYENRVVFHSITSENPNPVAVTIGKEQVKDLCDANGHNGKLSSPLDLIGFRVKAQVKIQVSEQYGDKNQVHYFSGAVPKTSLLSKTDELDDEIPF